MVWSASRQRPNTVTPDMAALTAGDGELQHAGRALLKRRERRLGRFDRNPPPRAFAGKRQLILRREDANVVIGVGSRRHDERRFREIRPHGDPLHRLGVETRASSTTATGLPKNGRAVNTSTCLKRRAGIAIR